MVQPPFTNLQSFNSCAIVLSYLVYEEEAGQLMRLLSKNAGKYHTKHAAVLSSFLAKYLKVESTKLPLLVSQFKKISFEWPT